MTQLGAVPAFAVRPSVFDVRWQPRGDYRDLLNLKSCETQHPDADRLIAELLADLRPADVRSYPYHVDLMRNLADTNGVNEDCVLLTAGSSSAIGLVVDGLAERSGRLLLQEPVFESWTYYAALRGVTPTTTAGLTGSPPALTTEELRAAMSRADSSVVALTNPGNPSGLVHSVAEMAELAGLAAERGHVLVIDECYGAFADFDHVPMLARFPNVIVLRSLSKGWALAGARIAAVFGAPPLIDYLRRFQTDSTVSALAVALACGVSARLDRMRAIRRDVVAIKHEFTDRVLADQPGWTALAPGGNFVTFATGIPGAGARIQRALAERRIRIRGLDDVPGMAGCLRFSLAGRAEMRMVADVLRTVTSADER
jgi:histidinol-phosphate aminotransferase